jgi:serine/threonine-protein kinase
VDSGETSFGRYRLLNLIGKGAMGQVFRAYDTETDRVVALKVLPPHMAQDEDFKRRFRREAHAAARLNEAHVVPIHGYGEIDGQLFVDMRLIDGQDLSAVLRAEPAGIDQNRAVRIVYQIALALDAAHQAALVHRDVKPSNILITDNDFAYLIDFGVVRATEEVSLTATGLALGTIAYMAPEQFTTGLVDPRSDVYSLTCVLFQCLVGRQPFLGGIEQKAAAHAVAPPPRPSLEKAGLAPELDEVILRGMAKNPNDRYQSALAFAEAARAALDRPAPRAPLPPPPVQGWQPAQFGPPAGFAGPQFPPVVPVPRPTRRRLGVLAVAGVAAVVAVASVVAVVASSDSSDGATPGASTTGQASSSASMPIPAGRQDTLPFPPLAAFSVTVDGSGTVYVPDMFSIRELQRGATTSTEVKLADGYAPRVMAAGPTGTLYMADLSTSRVAMLAPGSTTPVPLPFGPLSEVAGIAVGPQGAVYVTDTSGDRVLRLDQGADAPVALPFKDLDHPEHIAVGADGTVYVAASAGIFTMAEDATEDERLPDGPTDVGGIAVDGSGNLYVTDGTALTVSALPKGAGDWVELPFAGLRLPSSIAVDDTGNVYVLDEIQRVVELPAK